ncbi:MAG: hypothetical protein ACFFHV_18050 [Promethearchaeota archaeon]
MVLKDNIEYWEISLTYPEVKDDPYYIHNEIIINDDLFVKKVEELRDLIRNYCDSKNEEEREVIFDRIFLLIKNTENIQYHEFIAFWKAHDFTFSTYDTLMESKKKEWLKDLLIKYCQERRELFDEFGYTNLIVQSLYDNSASKRTGGSTQKKIIDLIIDNFDHIQSVRNLSEFDSLGKCYFSLDSTTEELFITLCYRKNIELPFRKKNLIILKVGQIIIFIKANHIKEGGGAQNRKVDDLINFIDTTIDDKNFFLISFLDGFYFNRFIREDSTGKVKEYKENIMRFLKNHKNNYFVNTEGLNLLFKDISG